MHFLQVSMPHRMKTETVNYCWIHSPAEFQYNQVYTWPQQRWFPGRSKSPQLHQTQAPGSERSYNTNLQLRVTKTSWIQCSDPSDSFRHSFAKVFIPLEVFRFDLIQPHTWIGYTLLGSMVPTQIPLTCTLFWTSRPLTCFFSSFWIPLYFPEFIILQTLTSFPVPAPTKTLSQHNAAATLFHGRDGVFGGMYYAT